MILFFLPPSLSLHVYSLHCCVSKLYTLRAHPKHHGICWDSQSDAHLFLGWVVLTHSHHKKNTMASTNLRVTSQQELPTHLTGWSWAWKHHQGGKDHQQWWGKNQHETTASHGSANPPTAYRSFLMFDHLWMMCPIQDGWFVRNAGWW